MNITPLKRPWERKYSYGTRVTPRSRLYRTRLWTQVLRPEFRLGFTIWEGHKVSNTLCIECFKEGRIIEGPCVDHIIAIKDGGSPTDLKNMQALCHSHHNRKSAIEGNNRRR